MTTTIHSNGSKWAGQEPDSIATLLEVLASTPLDPTFEKYGDFAYNAETHDGTVRFFGNFYLVSHVFRIDSNDPEVCDALFAAIRANKATDEYKQAKRERAIVPVNARKARV